jgi:hypothetical protein
VRIWWQFGTTVANLPRSQVRLPKKVNLFPNLNFDFGRDIFSNCMRCRLTGVGSYNIEATSMGAAWLLTSELVARLDGRMGELQYSFSGELPLQEYFSIIDQHFDVSVILLHKIILMEISLKIHSVGSS